MIIAIASGKGGTGKTTLAVALAHSSPDPISYLDCDVEEPNGHLFLKPETKRREKVTVRVPEIDNAKCSHCGKCSAFCQFNALTALPTTTLVFPELCHNCNGCTILCPQNAIHNIRHHIGNLTIGSRDHVTTIHGELRIGQAMAPPVIKAVKSYIPDQHDTIIDSPPGTSCPMITAIKGADYVILVTEPTPFGLHDLKLAVETVRKMNLPFGVVVNRHLPGNTLVSDFCRQQEIPLLLEIAESRTIAEAYSRGTIITEAVPELRPKLQTMLQTIKHLFTDNK